MNGWMGACVPGLMGRKTDGCEDESVGGGMVDGWMRRWQDG